MIDKRIQMQKALNNEKTEQMLCSVWRHLPEDNRKGNYVIQDQIEYYRKTNVDYIKIMSDGYFEYPVEIEVREAADWYRLQPLPDDHPYFTEQIERARAVVEAVGKNCMTFYNVFAAFSSIRFALTDELIMKHLREDEGAVLHALDVIAGDNARLSEKIICESGCDGIYFCVQGGEKNRFSHEEYRRIITPSDLKTLEIANRYSEWNILHCCGWAGEPNHLENWQDYPCRAVNWSVHVEEMDLLEGKAFFGGKTVIGGLDNTKESAVHRGDIAEMEKQVQCLKEKYQNIPGIIIGADCSFHSDVEMANIEKLLEIVHKD